jgi:hypothetical protein
VRAQGLQLLLHGLDGGFETRDFVVDVLRWQNVMRHLHAVRGGEVGTADGNAAGDAQAL